MNILFLSINLPVGDKIDQITPSFIWKEMRHLAKKGYNVYYLSGLPSHQFIDGIFFISKDELLESNRILRRCKNFFFALQNILFFVPMIRKSIIKTMNICGVERACKKAITNFNIDVVHTNFFAPDGEAAVLSAKAYSLPVVATLRGAELQNMPEIDYGAYRSDFYAAALQRSLHYISFFTAPNEYLCEKLHKEFSVPETKLQYVPNGVEKIPHRKNISNFKSEIQFVCICGLIYRKNLMLLFQSILSLEQSKFKLYVIGSGPLKNELVAFKKKYDLANVCFLEEMSKSELFKFLSECDCLINSSFFEGMPNVVLESLSIGVPCLVSDIPGHREIIKEGYNGFLFDPISKSELISKMEYILSNSMILSEMRDNCIKSVIGYSIEAKIDQYIEIYESVTTQQKNNKKVKNVI